MGYMKHRAVFARFGPTVRDVLSILTDFSRNAIQSFRMLLVVKMIVTSNLMMAAVLAHGKVLENKFIRLCQQRPT